MPLFKPIRVSPDGFAGPATGPAPTPAINAVPMPRWILGVRALQALFAIVILGLVAYAEHIYQDSYLQPPYIPTLLAALLTILIILPLTTPILLSLRRTYRPLIAFTADLLAALFWLSCCAVLASYSAVYYPDSVYGEEIVGPDEDFRGRFRGGKLSRFRGVQGKANSALAGDDGEFEDALRMLRRGWACGAAAAGFAGVEAILFLLTTLLFLHAFHTSRLQRLTSLYPSPPPPPVPAPPGVATTGNPNISAPLEATPIAPPQEPSYEQHYPQREELKSHFSPISPASTTELEERYAVGGKEARTVGEV